MTAPTGRTTAMNGDSLRRGRTDSPNFDPDAVVEGVRAAGLLRPGAPVLVMLSGGRDSTALLDLATRIAGPEHVQALHVNYGLRAAADAEEAHCRALASAQGIAELHIRRAGPPPPSGNLQAWARGIRYGAAHELAAADIAAGHTATDQVETILYRLASSPSRRALLGMEPRSGRLIRPLLGLTRAQTGAYCTARGLPWCEDDTNEAATYARGRARGNLVPALRQLHPAAEQNVVTLAETLRAEAAVLDELVEQTLAGQDTITLSAARALPPALAALVLQRLADRAAGRPAPGTARRAAEILALPPTAALDLPHGIRARTHRGTLQFIHSAP